MTDLETFLEKTWGDLLSRDAEKILAAFRSLDTNSREEVLTHLRRMSSEPGWHPEQVISAAAALAMISKEQES